MIMLYKRTSLIPSNQSDGNTLWINWYPQPQKFIHSATSTIKSALRDLSLLHHLCNTRRSTLTRTTPTLIRRNSIITSSPLSNSWPSSQQQNGLLDAPSLNHLSDASNRQNGTCTIKPLCRSSLLDVHPKCALDFHWSATPLKSFWYRLKLCPHFSQGATPRS